jgi:acetyltransferase
VVIIGASTSPEKLGYGAARNLVYSGYNGAIHFVGQKKGTLFNRPIYTGLSQVPDPVDLAILIVPAPATPETLEACGQRGIRAAIVVASGFREAGEEGAALEAECLEVAHKYGIRMVGPNCIGSLDTHLPLDTTFLAPPMPTRGHIGFISHSGAFCAAIIDWARNHGFGFSRLISLGNQADVDETDMLPVVSADEHTRVIVLYLEGVADGRRFVEVAKEVTRHKPVIALKVGRFEAGQRAAASHTGALAGSDTAYEAAFEKAGIFRADSAEQMFDWAQALAAWPPSGDAALSLSKGGNVAVLTNAGGPGVIAADALEVNGLHIANLSEGTEKSLAEILPPAASVRNPVDMLASASPDQYAKCLSILLADSNVDSALVILPPPPMYHTEEVADALIPIINPSEKPVLVALLGSELTKEAAKHFRRADIPTYTFPEKAASALGILARRAQFIITENTEITEIYNKVPVNSARPGAAGRAGVSSLVKVSPEELVAAYGIPTAPMKLAASADEAAEIAGEIGFPLVMKIASPDIPHKSDVGGVLLDLSDEQEVRDGYAQLVEKVAIFRPDARIEGVHLQRQIPPGQEVILGAVRDPQFGPLVMFGSGGVEVEGLKDVAFALGPLTQAEAESLVRKTWAGRRLDGYRSIPPTDKSAVVEAIVCLSRLAAGHPEIGEIEINPLRVLSQGVIALDVRIKA